MKRYSFAIPADMLAMFKHRCRQADLKPSEILRILIAKWINESNRRSK